MRAVLAACCVAVPLVAAGVEYPTRGGETGILDVPDAATAPVRGGSLAIELGVRSATGMGTALAPFPLSVVTGLGSRLEAGFALRQWARPGDPRVAQTLFSGASKLHLLDAEGLWPALALDAYADRFNLDGRTGARLIAATPDLGRLRLSGFAGAEHGPEARVGATAGLAAAIALGPASRQHLVLDAVSGPSGTMAGAALRFAFTSAVGASLGVDWLARESGLRVSLGLAVTATPASRKRASVAPAPAEPAQRKEAVPVAPAAPAFTDDRPHFRMRIAAGQDASSPVRDRSSWSPTPPERFAVDAPWPAGSGRPRAASPATRSATGGASAASARDAAQLQVEDAVRRHVAELAACLREPAPGARAALSLHVAADGSVTAAAFDAADGSPLAAAGACARRVAMAWRLPSRDGAYAVEIRLAGGGDRP